MSTLIATIAALTRGHAIWVEKLTLLEKVVDTVQVNMTWVCDNMKELPTKCAILETPQPRWRDRRSKYQ